MNSHNDNTVEAKLEAMEWMARYMKFLPPAAIIKINKDWKVLFYTVNMSPERTAMAKLTGHSTTGVETILMNLRSNKIKVEQPGGQNIDVSIYD